MSFYREQLESRLRTIDVKAERVLDLGGAQKPVKHRTRSWEVGMYTILDLPEFDIQKGFPKDIPQADIVFCLEVFEYLIDPLSALKTIYDALVPNGKAYVTFPLIYPVHNEIEFDSLRFTENGIRRLADAVGLKVNEVWYRRTKINQGFQESYLTRYYAQDGMKAARGMDHEITGYIVEFNK